MGNQIMVLLLTAILFAVMVKRRFSPKVLLLSIAAGALTLIGEIRIGVFVLYAMIDGLITFMMWYALITGIFLFISFFSRGKDQ